MMKTITLPIQFRSFLFLLMCFIAFFSEKSIAQTITNVQTPTVEYESAVITFDVNPNSAATTVRVQYSLQNNNFGPGVQTATVPITFSGNSTQAGSITLTGLFADRVYYCRVWGHNSIGDSYLPASGYFNFITPVAPTTPRISNMTVFDISQTSANVQFGLAAGNGLTQNSVEYSTDFNFITDLQSVAAGDLTGNIVTARGISLTGLTPSTLYYYRAKASNIVATVYSSPLAWFTTLGLVTVPTIANVSSITAQDKAKVSYTLNANNAETTTVINYGLTSDALNSLAIGFSANANLDTSNSTTITNLAPDTTYYYQIVATNSAGSALGTIESFTTPVAVVQQKIADYLFNNRYTNSNFINPFTANTGTSFVEDRNGNASSALQVLNVGTTATVPNIPQGIASRTISLWVKTTAYNPYLSRSYPFSFGDATGGQEFYTAPASVVLNSGTAHVAPVVNALNTWNHYAVVYDGITSKIYKDNVLLSAAEVAFNPVVNTSNIFKLGLLLNDSNGYFYGAIDDLKIYNYALTDAQIGNLYSNNQADLIAPSIVDSNKSVSATTAYLYASALPNGIETTILMRYGTSPDDLSSIVTGNPGEIYNAYIQARLSGLTPNTTYYYQIEATNAAGTVTTSTESFTTEEAKSISEYNFDNTYSDLLGNSDFSTNTGVSFVEDRDSNATSAIRLTAAGIKTDVLGFPINNGSRTISLWVNLSTIQSTASTIFGIGGWIPDSGFSTSLNETSIGFSAVSNDITVSSSNVANTWYHLVYTYDGVNMKIYKDGVLLTTEAKNLTTSYYDGDFTLGDNTSYDAVNDFDGAIDDLKFYNYALSDEEVENLYTNNSLTTSVVPTFTQIEAICSGDTSVVLPETSSNAITGTWSPGVNNTETTTYTFTPTSGQSATEATMTITVNPSIVPTFTQVAPICTGETLTALPTTSNNAITGTWSPALNNTVTTTYTFTPSAGQCATTETMTIVVNPSITPIFTQVSPICTGETLVVLPMTSNNAITGTWSPVLNNTATTTYTFTPSAGQCATTETMTIVVNPSIVPIFTQVAPICTGGTLVVLPTTSNNAITGIWSPALNNATTTAYTFTPSAGQCATTETMTIVVNSSVTPTFTQVSPICADEMLDALPITSNNAITGIWSPVLNNTTTTTYTFTPSTGQCATTETMTIVVNPSIAPAFTQVAPICTGETLVVLPMTSNNAITGTWSPVLNNTVTTTYTFTPSAGQCATTETMTIVVNPSVVPTFTQVAPICSGEMLTALPTTSNNAITGSWSPVLNNTATTTYTFTPTADQCATTETMTIVVNSVEAPTGLVSQSFTEGAVIADLVISPSSVVWYESDSDAISGINALLSNTILVNGTVYYAVNQSGNCTSTPFPVTAMTTLGIDDLSKTEFKIFPNPVNDVLNIETTVVIKSVEFFTIHGQRVLQSNQKQINVSNLEKGVYMIRIKDVDDSILNKKIIIK